MGAHRTPVVGHIDCPTCGLDMDVKHDKNGHAMGYCPDCSQQLFTRNDHRSGKLLERMRACAPGQVGPAAPGHVEPKPVKVPIFVPPTAPASSASASSTPPVRVQEHKQDANTSQNTNPAPKPGGWWAPLLSTTTEKGNKHV